jgi:hypothetical protein
MTNFKAFQTAVQNQFQHMSQYPLFKVQLDRDAVVETYLNAFPFGSNELYRERTAHDCSCCKHFIRTAGGIVAITPNGPISIWDVTVGDSDYQIVANAMKEYVLSKNISNAFLHYENHIGTHHNFEDNGPRWDHFYIDIPNSYVIPKDQIDTRLGKVRTNQEMYLTAMQTITTDAIATVQDLIAQNSIYRGEEFKKTVNDFAKAKNEYLTNWPNIQMISWLQAINSPGICRFKNSVIGTLVTDLANGVDLEDAVKMYESKVAPQNYKRTTTLITQGMIDQAQKKVEELGIANALYRRFAKTDDLTINNVLFADRSAKKDMGVFENLKNSTKPTTDIKNLEKVQEIQIDKFIKEVVPKIDTMEVFFEGRHKNNLMSLVAPSEKDAPPIFKWNNNFSWSYNGEVTDSIKERVKRAGGNVTGDLRFSLSWFNTDDLDLHAKTPSSHIYYASKRDTGTTGKLDVDMNVSNLVTDPVENIVWHNKRSLWDGAYHIYVNQFTKRNTDNGGFVVEMEFMGEKQEFVYDKIVRSNANVTVCKFTMKDGVLKIKESLSTEIKSEPIWNTQTQKFNKVKMLVQSPNHWDGQTIGNKHWFFIGFYNEFLKADLTDHRKVFEVLSSKTKVPQSTTQLSGLGFSSTKPDHVLCRVKGSFNRIVKVIF